MGGIGGTKVRHGKFCRSAPMLLFSNGCTNQMKSSTDSSKYGRKELL
jgi:hypothetical protein